LEKGPYGDEDDVNDDDWKIEVDDSSLKNYEFDSAAKSIKQTPKFSIPPFDLKMY